VEARHGGRRPPPREVQARGPVKLKEYTNSDGVEHLGSALGGTSTIPYRPFPGPPPESDNAPPLRILPIGGLGEIGMNCMMAGVRDRYIVIDAGLMFPDFSDLGMQKILPDTSFLHQWRDRIEALVITHGHEDHIGALPWVVPALDPSTPIYASSFVMKLIKRRLTEYSLFDESRFKVFDMRVPFQAGPFEIEAVRVTHSIPDCCGLIMRSEEGTIVHTGDWKIDETPLDGQHFDRAMFDALGKEKVSLFMSDSTNVLSPGRTASEAVVHDAIVNKVMGHAGKGRVIVTQFASNLARLNGVRTAAEASGRKICFVGASLHVYLEAAWQDGRAPIDPKDLIAPEQLKDYDPNQVLIVTTGSQAEPRAQLSMAAREASHTLKILPEDLILYSAKVIPGNEPRVARMLNSLAAQGARVIQGRGENLHTSGHAYQEELKEVLRYVKPQHFLPVHGEYAFLTEHAALAQEQAGVKHCSVIKNGQLLAVGERRNRNTVSSGSAAIAEAKVLGDAKLLNFYNDGSKGTGTDKEMGLTERTTMAFEGVVVVAVDVVRDGAGPFSQTVQGKVRVTTRGMWTDQGRLQRELHEGITNLVARMPVDASLASVERVVVEGVTKLCRQFNQRRPEVICVAHEHDPRLAHIPTVSARRRADDDGSAQGATPAAGRGRGAAMGSRRSRDDEGQAQVYGSGEDPSSSRRGRPAGGAPKPWERASRSPASNDAAAESGAGGESFESQPQPQPAAGAGAGAGSKTRELIEARKRAAAARQSPQSTASMGLAYEEEPASPPPAAPKAGRKGRKPASPPPLQVVPEEVMRKRRAANPRDNADARAADPDHAAYD